MKPAESFIAQPIRSLQTMLRVLHKDNNSIPPVVPDGIYGQTTLAAVTEFQRQNELPMTGVTDEATWQAIVDAYQPALIRTGKAEPIEILMEPGEIFQEGSSGAYVYLAQSMLIWLSDSEALIPEPAHTGFYDRQTADAVLAFQTLAGLEGTGRLDRITWHHLARHFTLEAARRRPSNVIMKYP